MASCRSETSTINPNSPEYPREGTATDAGVGIGTAVSLVIGPEGGTITVSGGKATLVIPAGAVDKQTTFTIQPITNPAPNGMGSGYRLLPQDLKLGKAASLSITYTNAELAGNTADMIGMAQQKADKVWYTSVGQKVDGAYRTVTAPVTTLGDIALYRQYALVDESGMESDWVAYYGATMRLLVSELAPMTVNNGEPLRRITATSASIGWNLSGHGKMTGSGLAGTYVAPAYHPEQNPVTVAVSIPAAKAGTVVTLSRPVYVGMGYIRYTLDGKTTLCTTVSLKESGNSYSTILGASDTTPVNLTFRATGTGTLPFGDYVALDNRSGLIVCRPSGSNMEWFDTRGDCMGLRYATGQVAISQYTKNKVVKGSLTGTLIPRANGCSNSGPGLSGEFLVKVPVI
ncbi:hypothetical protein [Arsenicibacter rosenii]|uniref:ZU5 domain-containing protein n=1 Tax=Arsenicibacter rosenii TaxID=1750698 RepID=A0A1S2VIC6_9BACT|nr:hypothetical protein [Arsenicibacter rosenii]OIN58489.1 hypothetical protein BLX24_13005 [Arsenicibacter rosenii]